MFAPEMGSLSTISKICGAIFYRWTRSITSLRTIGILKRHPSDMFCRNQTTSSWVGAHRSRNFVVMENTNEASNKFNLIPKIDHMNHLVKRQAHYFYFLHCISAIVDHKTMNIWASTICLLDSLLQYYETPIQRDIPLWRSGSARSS